MRLGRLDAALTRLEDAMLLVCCVCLLAIVGITTADVLARGAFNAPFAWSHDLITQYLLVAMFFLSLPYVTRIGGHMALDFLARKIGNPGVRSGVVLFGETLALLFVLGFVAGAWGTVVDAWQGGDVLAGELAWPTWPSRLVGPVGGAVLALRLALRMVETVEAMRGRTLPAFLDRAGH